jgi:hypothetical protein
MEDPHCGYKQKFFEKKKKNNNTARDDLGSVPPGNYLGGRMKNVSDCRWL